MKQIESFKDEKVQKTYKGKTAGGLLKRVQILKMQAGNYETVASMPDGEQFVVRVHKDEKKIYLNAYKGCVAVLQCSDRAYDEYRLLEADCCWKLWQEFK
jgi:hypothetical protein